MAEPTAYSARFDQFFPRLSVHHFNVSSTSLFAPMEGSPYVTHLTWTSDIAHRLPPPKTPSLSLNDLG